MTNVHDDPDYLNAELIDQVKYIQRTDTIATKLDMMWDLRETWSTPTSAASLRFWVYVASQGDN